ncbi:MAG: thiopeptide-type bacteriocin biosynthesis protein [Bacteroidota bacterium]
MTNSIKTEWLAIHLYYNAPWERFLIHAVKPFIDTVRNHPQVQGYFFIRYGEMGPHIRLRFKGESDYLINQLKPLAEESFLAYMEAHPSKDLPKTDIPKFSYKEKLFPNNSIQWIKYEPEIDRYGGKKAISLAESHFQSSSEAVLLNLEAQTDSWSYESAMGVAIQMHLGFSYAVGMSQVEMYFFYTRLFQTWFPSTYYYQTENRDTHLEKVKETILESFKTSFQHQKAVILPHVQHLWEYLHASEAQMEERWFTLWVSQGRKVDRDMKTLISRKDLIIPSYFLSSMDASGIDRPEFFVYESFFHMTNNRLGIQNQDEGFLAYVLMESLDEIFTQSVGKHPGVY